MDGLDESVKKAVRYLKTRAFRKGGFGYCAGNAPSGLTATGCLALQLLGLAREKEVRSALDFMRAWGPVWENHPGGRNAQYYSYYATQCKYQAGMRKNAAPADLTSWKKWNAEMKAAYPSAMTELPERIPDSEGRPCAMGYWQNRDAYMGCHFLLQCMKVKSESDPSPRDLPHRRIKPKFLVSPALEDEFFTT